MKQTILFTALGLAAFGAAAQEVGNVISSQPIVQQVAVPRQVCNQPMMAAPAPNSGVGTVLGALIGGGIGSQVGGGSGRAAAVGVGAVAGALLGTGIETSNNAMAAQAQMQPQCSTQTSYENRTVAWNVTYEYAGRQYNVQMPYDPGPTVRLQVNPVGAGAQAEGYAQAPQGQGQGAVVTAPPMQSAPAPAPMQQVQQVQTYAAPMVVPPAPPAQVVYSGQPYPYYAQPYPVYPAYRPYYYPPVSLSFGYVYRGGGGHRHWR